MTEKTCPITNGLPTLRERPFDPPQVLRAEGPICRMAFPDGHEGWLVTSYQYGREILSDKRFSSAATHKHLAFPSDRAQDMGEGIPGLFEHMDPPEHTKFRKLLAGQFTLRRMRALTPRIEEITAQYAEAMLRKGAPADLVADYSVPVSSQVICELLGVPFEDRERFEGNSAKLLRLDLSTEETQAALMDLVGLTGELLMRKQAEPADDVLSVLVNGEDMSLPEAIGATLLLLVAGHETTANMLSLGTYALLNNPDQMALLRADESLIEGAVEELLRYLTVVHVGVQRSPTEDVEIGGVTLHKGDTVLIHLPTANRDPEQFTDPDRLDVTQGTLSHLTFSHGIHQCLGQQLARLELRIGYTELLRRFPELRLAATPDEIPMRSNMTVYGVHELPVAW
ncbi:Cytochrome P450 [Streptomyces davaonensis JCM 4913]|uniref:Cytochrome P450 n=1 Tax=Streptomyces davaonensis (strain DSM 101723 / JCM 4913 / KCC S-0913 / 768) TaxID=1214101 RepID=K4QXF5_STRDJ|nr:cytochrome P450 [Streptomyces davaonensis]CCK25059.1 Cytochrome P450 [Streptomyces davaonensis JCM 4913]